MASKENVTEGWEKWKIALAVGAPIALGLAGLWYYNRVKSSNLETKKKDIESGEKKEEQPEAKAAEPQTPVEQAQAAKNKGNKWFKGGKYDQAIQCYTEAIKICPPENKQDISTFYQNRAAAHEQLKNFTEVIADCSKALEFNTRYTKAMFRRAKACEHIGDLQQCLEDVTAVCILEGFQNQQSLMMADRVLKDLGKSKAKEAYKNRKETTPSHSFLRTYFSAFANDPIISNLNEVNEESPETVEAESEAEKYQDESPEKEMKDGLPGKSRSQFSPFLKAKKQLAKKEYDNVIELCTQEISNSTSKYLPEALLLRATFYLLAGRGTKAIDDLNQVIGLEDVDKKIKSNALIKRGSLKLQLGEQTEALDDMATAVRVDPENSDIYHHRGQLNLLLDRMDDALRDFDKCVALNPEFAVAHAQKCYAEYRHAFDQRSPMQLQSSVRSFEDLLKRFPDCAEAFALYGQALCDQQQFDQADDQFKKAIKIEPDNANVYVHRGLLRLQWKQNMEEACSMIKKALEVDDKCEFAYETLGTIEVQRGNLTNAIDLFNKAISLAKTEMEMAHLFSLLDAAMAQSKVAQNFGIQVPTMGPM
ncbi:mitochondrial import receptor subunit TOM70 [Lingula anatina]|uniref:Mitochondrial import receptor subunit TOM70 n=1 Tax=Lingula anatina TaxID=7574 RepID=A0A1S3J513_LINAN|nr:mitochondrial import receptor subunit TOM70 [Lingula anatina]|eukprot:XP_013405522.1 mitochondrial import receptor subunit TOM70 [Lingula anatina]